MIPTEEMQRWKEQGFSNEWAWLQEGACGRCHDVCDDERGVPVASVGETPADATEAMRRNLASARKQIRKPLCAQCQQRLALKPGGDRIVFGIG